MRPCYQRNSADQRKRSMYTYGTLSEGNKVLVRNLSERGGTGKLRSYWEDKIHTIVRRVDKLPVYDVRPFHGGKIRRLHHNMLKECNKIIETNTEDIENMNPTVDDVQSVEPVEEEEDEEDDLVITYFKRKPRSLTTEESFSPKQPNSTPIDLISFEEQHTENHFSSKESEAGDTPWDRLLREELDQEDMECLDAIPEDHLSSKENVITPTSVRVPSLNVAEEEQDSHIASDISTTSSATEMTTEDEHEDNETFQNLPRPRRRRRAKRVFSCDEAGNPSYRTP